MLYRRIVGIVVVRRMPLQVMSMTVSEEVGKVMERERVCRDGYGQIQWWNLENVSSSIDNCS
jgi:hypothetical protein